MQIPIQQVQVPSLKEACITQLESLILSGELHMGDRLPAERDLAARLGVSRPVLHEALVDLESKGLVQIVPRHGAYISDYRRNGSLAMLSSLMAYNGNKLDPQFGQSMLEMRLLVETETARLAAKHHTQAQLDELRFILEEESAAAGDAVQDLVELDFAFHHLIAMASGNVVYPLILNSFRSVYTSLTGEFFQNNCNSPIVHAVHQYHKQLVNAIAEKSSVNSIRIMVEMLKHGEIYLKGEVQ